jgi:DNA-binding LacI/PurR family transcriptional regulator
MKVRLTQNLTAEHMKNIASEFATIDDVARIAKVSPMTVSLVARRKESGRVSKETAARVREVILDLKYRPNISARHMRAQQLGDVKTHSIGYLFHTASQPGLHPYFADILVGANEAAEQHNQHLLMGHGHASLSDLKSQMILLTGSKVDGWLLGSIHEPQLITFLAKAEIPSVWVGSSADTTGLISQVRVDDFQGGYLAVQHLTQLGHRRIAYIDILPGTFWHEQTLAGCRRAMEEAGIADFVVPPQFHHSDPVEVERVVDVLLDMPEPPTAIFVRSDNEAVTAIHHLKERGLRVPEDVSVIGFDDLEIGRRARPDLTTVISSRKTLGVMAVQLLLQVMERPKMKPCSQKLPVRVEVRDSTGIKPD